MAQTHRASQGICDYEYVASYSYTVPHQSMKVTIGGDNEVQKIGEIEIKVVEVNLIRTAGIAQVIEDYFPASDGWSVGAPQPGRVIEPSQVDLWNISLRGRRYVASP